MRPPLASPLDRLPRRDDGRIDVDAVAEALRAVARVQVLETVPDAPHAGRWSYVAIVEGTLTDDGDRTALRLDDGTVEDLGSDPFAAIGAVCERWGWTPDAPRAPGLPPLSGGLVGVLAYDLARRVERLPTHARRDREVPDVDLAVCRRIVAVDHREETALLVGPEGPGPDALDVAAVLAAAPASDPRPHPAPPSPVRTSLPRDAYLRAVEEVLGRIAAGDTFQVNLSQRLTARWDGDVHDLYRALRSRSGAAFGAVVGTVGPQVASISPETFLLVDGRSVRTRPIKGTRPRGGDAAEDERLREELVASEKDHAENVMVVDMERNDLGRVCEPGSVHVPRLLELEGHPTVWHLVSTVEGTLRPDVGYGELLRATFPCGSVTGTPKVMAMRIIDELEPVRRGVYCGAIGFLAAGAASASVAIRTATLHRDGTVDYGAGGGVVADSDPAAEHAESLDKAAAFLRAVAATEVVPAPR
ncbi:MAG: aminodeoxychorismate synthase component I [Actinobacteria bacterium]|nr:aminodeoxychorismate synthase component I [Actinomycetota bacterium]